jgi:beta-glucanase (GH16 family)
LRVFVNIAFTSPPSQRQYIEMRPLHFLLPLELLSLVAAQTYSNCNPLYTGACPADSALGTTVSIDFTQGASDSFTAQGALTYDATNGIGFTVAKAGDAPLITSLWYIMFGRIDVSIKAAPGAGIVSSFVLQSDDLDEVDWEWLGADADEVQTNYFGKGQTTTYNRGAFDPAVGSQSDFHTYTLIWTASQIVWQVDGVTVRVLTAATAEANQYPQTPMQVKLGAWSGGDSANAPGTIQWARGPTDYSKGPFTMYVKNVKVQDYSTGTSYVYGDTSGSWQSIKSNGGTINSEGGGSSVISSAPAVTSTSTGQPQPFVASGSGTTTYTNYPGLPSGWTVSPSGKVLPPNGAVRERTLSLLMLMIAFAASVLLMRF